MQKIKFLLIGLAFTVLVAPLRAHAWGARGHGAICEAATLLMPPSPWATSIRARTPLWIHLCVVPDVLWRKDTSSISDHFVHLEKWDETRVRASSWPAPWLEQNGALLVRIDDLQTRALEARDLAKSTTESTKFSGHMIDMMTAMGVLGHYVGDLSQPLHTTEDFDGHSEAAHGLHTYYETDLVASWTDDLTHEVYQAARKAPALHWPKEGLSTREKAWILAQKIHGDLKRLPENWKEICSASASAKCERMKKDLKKMAISEMAISAQFLAELWQELASSSVDMEKISSGDYPSQPAYLPIRAKISQTK